MNISDFRDRHRHEEVAILCNGPTLADHDLQKIDCMTIGLNASWLLHKADYHLATDIEHFGLYQLERGDISRLTPLFCADDGPDHAVKLNILDKPDTMIEWSYDLTHGVYLCGFITWAALQLAGWMGFTYIYLIGFDLQPRDGLSKFKGHPWAGRPYRDRLEARQRELMGYAAGLMFPQIAIRNLSGISKCRAFPKLDFDEVFR